MRSAWAIMTIVACAGLAGCAERFDEARPDDWQQGAPLMAYIGGKGHDAGEQYWLRPPNGTEAPTPARCVAYQGGRHATDDACRVWPPGQSAGFGPSIVEWTVEASWDGKGQDLNRDVEQHPEARTVAAFDAAGVVVAYWDGTTRDPDGSFSTE